MEILDARGEPLDVHFADGSARAADHLWGLEKLVGLLTIRPMSTDAEIREDIERLKQTIEDAKRLKQQLALQIKDANARLEKMDAARSKEKKPNDSALL